ncbi:MAG: hypothetical protein U9Q85_03280 [Patescibacteria group bacterium]|nr:hypothetical protein [Patescibacteria group bacterium]
MLYTALLIVVVERELDNKFLRGLSGYLSLPAYISQDGLIDYYTYIDTKNILSSKFSQAEELDRAVKTQIVESIISNNLLLKYNIQISLKKLSLIEIKNILLEEIMHDQTINQVGLARINKIKDLIKKEDDFIKIANRYGDSQDKITLSLPDDLNDFPHLSELKDIEIGEVSGVINDNSGYYIYRCFDKREDNLYLSYVYVKGKTLNDYIKERVGQYKLWSLVD